LVHEATVRAAEIARAVGDRRSHADALILGEAELELSRLRMVQQDLLSRAFAALAGNGGTVSREGGASADLAATIQELCALERYERRALSRQKNAVRRLTSLLPRRSQGLPSEGDRFRAPGSDRRFSAALPMHCLLQSRRRRSD
jgi:hypothetical protein